jgi:hypothetical protein
MSEQDLGSFFDQILQGVQEHLIAFALLILAEFVVAFLLKKIVHKVAGVRLSIIGWGLLIILTPPIHHVSHLFPVVGHILTALLLSALLGSVYKVEASGESLGIAGGFGMLCLRLLIHYVVFAMSLLLVLNYVWDRV